MYQNWLFFRTVLDNTQLEMARAKLNIAAYYTDLFEKGFHDQIVSDFEKAHRAISEITGQQQLLENQQVIQKSIILRNPYTDVLNLLQIELIQRCRHTPESQCEPMRNALFLSINGIAAAMQSTG